MSWMYSSRARLAKKQIQPKYHALSRPPEAEGEATGRGIRIAQMAGGPHLHRPPFLGKEALEQVRAARDAGFPAFAETCPQDLLLSFRNYLEPGFNGAKFVMSPPLRDKSNWEGTLEGTEPQGTSRWSSTDHCPFNFKGQKDMNGKEDYKKIPNGAPGIETMLMLLHSEGVVKGRISLERMVDVLSTGTARMFGLATRARSQRARTPTSWSSTRKRKFTLAQKKLHQNVDYTPWEGWEVTGTPEVVYSRGRRVAEWSGDRMKFVGEGVKGRFVKRVPLAGF